MATRLGWLGPAIVAVGAAVAALGVWFMLSHRPTPGAQIDSYDLGGGQRLVVRAETGGNRAFVELHTGDVLTWQALVPPYAGKPGVPAIAWSDIGISVRVIRNHKAELFQLSRRDASKLGGIHLATDHGPINLDAPGPITLTDHQRSYEIIAGDGWNQLAGVDLKIGKLLWKQELGPAPVTAGAVEGGLLRLEQGGTKRYFRVLDGTEDRSVERIGPPPTTGVAPLAPVPTPGAPAPLD